MMKRVGSVTDFPPLRAYDGYVRAGVLREIVERETGYDAARERSVALLREGADLGTGGRVTWSRDDLHER